LDEVFRKSRITGQEPGGPKQSRVVAGDEVSNPSGGSRDLERELCQELARLPKGVEALLRTRAEDELTSKEFLDETKGCVSEMGKIC
jgi:hypothetical protein